MAEAGCCAKERAEHGILTPTPQPHSAHHTQAKSTADGSCTELLKGAKAPADASTEFGTYDQFSQDEPGGTDYSVSAARCRSEPTDHPSSSPTAADARSRACLPQ